MFCYYQTRRFNISPETRYSMSCPPFINRQTPKTTVTKCTTTWNKIFFSLPSFLVDWFLGRTIDDTVSLIPVHLSYAQIPTLLHHVYSCWMKREIKSLIHVNHQFPRESYLILNLGTIWSALNQCSLTIQQKKN